MVASIVQHSLQVDHWVAGQHAVDAGLLDALFHRGEEILGHGAAEHFFREYGLFAFGVGLESDPHIAELAGAAGLLLVAALFGDHLTDLLPVGHPGFLQLSLHAEAVFKLGHQHISLDIAGSGEHHLVSLTVVDHGEGGILLVKTG